MSVRFFIAQKEKHTIQYNREKSTPYWYLRKGHGRTCGTFEITRIYDIR